MLPPVARCASCRAPIRWFTTPTGNQIPIDESPVLGGNVEMEDGIVTIVKPEPEVLRHITHFATCPNAARHRRKKI